MTTSPIPQSVVYKSLGLKAIRQSLEGVSNSTILELGPALGQSIEFWSHYSASIYVADLRSTLPPGGLSGNGEPPEAELDWNHLLQLPRRRFDVILSWDLFNYLELPIVSSLVRHLSHYCRTGTVLFSLIFDQQQMPEEPSVYRIVDEEHLSYEYSGSRVRSCTRHQPRPLARTISEFRTSSSFRLRNGVIEYLFSYEDDGCHSQASPILPGQRLVKS